MLRNIHKKLVSTHPQLWNTRVLPLLGIMLVCHLLFYFAGYLSVSGIRYLADHDEDLRLLDDVGILMFSFLLISIIIIVWLLFYLRNNPFKNFYPVNKTYLRREFLISWMIFLSVITVYHSYLYGRHNKLLKITAMCNPEKEIAIVNQAVRFIPQDIDNFSIHNCCDSIDARQRLQSMIHVPENDRCGMPDPEYTEPVQTYIPDRYAISELAERVDSYSYLYFCEEPFFSDGDPGLGRKHYQDIAVRWLKNGHRDSVKHCLNQYFTLLRQYQLNSYINTDTLSDWCFRYPDFSVQHTISNSSNHYPESASDYYADMNSLPQVIQEVERERKATFFSISYWFAYLYGSFGLACILLMFRITRLKPWLAAIIGVGIWSILIAMFAQADDDSVPYLINFLAVFFLAMALIFIRNKANKLLSAIWLNWFAFAFMLFIPITAELIRQHTGEVWECINNIRVLVKPAHPIHMWISDNWETINALNLATGILVILFVIIPAAYRWQANPSE